MLKKECGLLLSHIRLEERVALTFKKNWRGSYNVALAGLELTMETILA